MLGGNIRTIGLDLGATGVRVVEISWNGERPVLERWAAADFPAEVTGWRGQSAREAGVVLQELLARNSFRTHWAAHSVSGEAVAPQYFNFPQLMPEDVPEAVRIEVESGLPFRVEQALIDYILFKEFRPEPGKVRTHGLAVAADGEYVESRLSILREARLEPFCIETDATACANALIAHADLDIAEETVAILNIGHLFSNLALLGQGGNIFIRDIPWAGKHTTLAISEFLAVPVREAERLKRLHWTDGPAAAEGLDKRMSDVVEQCCNSLGSRLRETVMYWVGERLLHGLTRLYLTGGGSQVRGLPERLSELLGVRAERWSPLASVEPDTDPERSKWAYRLTVAAGLALRKFGSAKSYVERA